MLAELTYCAASDFLPHSVAATVAAERITTLFFVEHFTASVWYETPTQP